ncbi:general odorant-binding protein 69a [Anabrus simplex]|uniref:general odorant-binding protein 69a n=1 Tax=Anabrus simplex TaxID=316456 RepID=UPI0034DD7ED3
MMLKLISAIAFWLVVVCVANKIELSGKVMEMAKELDKTCRTETGAPRDSLQKYIHGLMADNEQFKCYIKCIMVQIDSLSDDGVFSLEAELDNVPPEIREEGHRIVHDCKTTTGVDACDTAYQIHMCYNRSNPQLYAAVLHTFDFKIDE